MEFYRGLISSEQSLHLFLMFLIIPDRRNLVPHLTGTNLGFEQSSSSSPTPGSQEYYRYSNRDNSTPSNLHFSTGRLFRLKRVATTVEQAHLFVKGLLTAYLLEGPCIRIAAMVRKIPPKTIPVEYPVLRCPIPGAWSQLGIFFLAEIS